MTLLTRARPRDDLSEQPWTGPTRPYDLLKEFTIALVVVSVLTVALAAVFSSPHDPQVTISSWATAAPNDFVATAATELDGSSGTATYGPPYTNTPDAAQKLGPLCPACWRGATIPVNTAQDYVLGPLASFAQGDSTAKAALDSYQSASATQQQSWATAYDKALQKAPDNNPAKVAAGDYGPVPTMLGKLLDMAKSGGLTGYLLTEGNGFYQTDYTKPLLFIADGTYLSNLADAQHLSGDQWGMMNETGNYPGQSWLWLYTMWYQVPPFSTSGNADALVWAIMAALTLLLAAVPFLPGLRSIPRWIPLHRLIWRDYYRTYGRRT